MGRIVVGLLGTVWLAIVPFLLLDGCRRDASLGRIQGRVTIDGQPLDSGVVRLLDAHGGLVTAELDPQGRFAIRQPRNPGLLPGPYRLSVLSSLPRFPLRYSTMETSGLAIEVIAGENPPLELALAAEEVVESVR